MNLSDLEKDIEMVAKAIEQSIANHNVLVGQKQALEHVLNKMKTAATDTETVVNAVEQVVNTSPTTQETPANE